MLFLFLFISFTSSSIAGGSKCAWSSCREGCTRDIFECNQIVVEYSLENEAASKQRAALFVNVKGCGYPPSVQCSSWIDQYGVINSTIPCHYSRTNTSMAITHVDSRRSMRDLLLGTLVPIVALLVSGVALCTMHTKCSKARNTNMKAG